MISSSAKPCQQPQLRPAGDSVYTLHRDSPRSRAGTYISTRARQETAGHVIQCEALSPVSEATTALPHAQLAKSKAEAAAISTRRTDVVGRIELIIGPMFAGKSTELLRRVRTERSSGRQVALVKSHIDSRYSCKDIYTHAGDKLPCVTSDRLLPILSDQAFMAHDTIAVDEAQFFPDLIEFVVCASETHMKTVLVAGLDGDFRRQKFGQILDLIPLADSVTKMHGKCHLCDAKSLFSFRMSADDQQELVGHGDKYVPTCRYHHAELTRRHEVQS